LGANLHDVITVILFLGANSISNSTSKDKSRNKNLDKLRGAAALFVAFGHLLWVPTQPTILAALGAPGNIYPTVGSPLLDTVTRVFTPSEAWVMVFFLLSGYVVEPSVRRLSPAIFLKKRIVRVYLPFLAIYVLWTSLQIALHSATLQIGPLEILKDLPLINGGIDGISGPQTLTVIWTLWFEVRYYLYAALLTRIGIMATGRLALASGATIALMVADSAMVNIDLSSITTAVFGLAFISLGAVFREMRELTRNWLIAVAVFGAALFFGQRTSLFEFFATRELMPFWMAIALFISALAFENLPDGRFGEVMNKLGEYSYSLYLSHFVFGLGGYLLLAPTFGYVFSIFISFLLAAGGTWVFYKLVEAPSLRIVSRIGHEKGTRSPL
jgi:peptidoglycan/LPS O-acetylase OafA/YrhL